MKYLIVFSLFLGFLTSIKIYNVNIIIIHNFQLEVQIVGYLEFKMHSMVS